MPNPHVNLAAILVDTAARHPDRPAVRLDGTVLGYAELDEAAARAAALLRDAGAGPGDRIGLSLPNVPAFAVFYYAILRAGSIVVPLNPLLKAGEVEHQLRDSDAALLIAPSGADEAAGGARAAGVPCLPVDADRLDDLLDRHPPQPGVTPRAPQDTAVILYTSGTTGRPKGAELTHDNLIRNTEITRTTLLRLTEQDVVFGGLPLFHAFGQVVGLTCATAAGACLTLLPRFEAAKALEIIDRDGVTAFLGVPTMYSALLAAGPAGGDTRSLRVCVSGGAAMPVEVLRSFEEAFGCTVLEGYGLSETSPVACFNHPDRPRRPGTIGTPVLGVELRVLDSDGREVPDGERGEIAVRGHNVMKGYWRNPEATAAAVPDGWLRTGDIGIKDPDGCFRIVDRKKELIIRGGFNVYPREIEEVLYRHPAVGEAAVIGVPHPTHGEEIAAVVALKPGASAEPADLRDFAKAEVAPYKYPRIVRIVAALPKGPTGKILKREIELPSDQEI
ncbi:long-chain fatty acid--CoA ligase [Kitasatospora sp. NPDC059571]|uniref:long-chain-fatty-acid--CoA ligase n=1 Tax=Kitasatospora sp. NPDC059571 TaxID=3346871 RepID=UPI0036C14B83